jgi:metal-responsive CopG/Arc/MetJ family transcriptional regulator
VACLTRKGKDLEIVSVCLPQGTVRDVDRAVADVGYPSRSELVRDAIRGLLKSKSELDSLKGHIAGVIILIYDHGASKQVSDVRHAHMDIFISFMHSDLRGRAPTGGGDAHKCCEVLMFSGEASEVREAYNQLRSVRSVEDTTLYVA